MTSTGMIRNVDHLGRIVLPKELRNVMGITPDTPMEIFIENETIMLRKYKPAGCCDLCGQLNAACVELHGKHICPDCRRQLLEK